MAGAEPQGFRVTMQQLLGAARPLLRAPAPRISPGQQSKI